MNKSKTIKLLSITIFGLFSLVLCPKVSAASFEAGRIIDDVIMANSQSMTVAQIQAFLDSKVPVCDNNGTMGTTSTSRSEYFASKGWPMPLKCLKEYTENGKLAAQIIYDAGQEYTINPQVLIVLLQKEQGLVTDDWPDPTQYRSATGYGCPDTAACDSEYYGFTNQVRNAAKMFRKIMDASPTWHTPYVLGDNYIQYSPNSSCGGSVVTIQNRATQGLYNYTPYQPNTAALNTKYGTGDGCSAYGNRNFYNYFTDWFGSTTAVNGTLSISSGLLLDATSYAAGDTVTASYEVTNSADFAVQAGGLGICARQNGQNLDFGYKAANEIPAKGKITVSYPRQITNSGDLTIFICSFHTQLGGWAGDRYPYNPGSLPKSVAAIINDNPLVTTSVSFNPATPIIGQPVTATFSITNSSSNPVTIGAPALAVRGPNRINADFSLDSLITIGAGSTYTYSKTNTFTVPGTHNYFITNKKDGVWNDNYPKSGPSAARSGSIEVLDNILVTTGVTFEPATPVIGQPVTATFTVTNSSSSAINIGAPALALRSPTSKNADFALDSVTIIAAGSTYTYSKTSTFSSPGVHSFFITNKNNGAWNDNYPKASAGIVRSGSVNILDSALITTGVTFDPVSPSVGQPVTATFTVTNSSSAAVSIGMPAIAVRDAAGTGNFDFAKDSTSLTVAANSTYTYSKSRTFEAVGTYSYFITNLHNGRWNLDFPMSANGNIVRSGSLVVQ